MKPVEAPQREAFAAAQVDPLLQLRDFRRRIPLDAAWPAGNGARSSLG
jgi:hypothetical protein